MKTNTVKAALAVVVLLLAAGETRAQLFGKRVLGQGVARRAGPGKREPGTLAGSERFLRSNRRGSDFVGTDSRERRSFVGSLQGDAAGEIRSATSGLRIQKTPNVNRKTAGGQSGRSAMYRPRIAVAFDFTPRPPQTVSSELARRLTASPSVRAASPIEVSLEGETATLRGKVASERDRTMAAILALFEPGISQVRNELEIDDPAPAPPEVPADSG